jgi:tetratricopeptide (TPR) repeat protein
MSKEHSIDSQKANKLLWQLPLCIAVITFLCYSYSLHNQFTNWDDERFITDNNFIRSFSSDNVKAMLLHDVTNDYYNPITILSYAINYHFAGLSPFQYYLTNIILHIINCVLLFFFVLLLLKAMEKNGLGNFKYKEWLAAFCTLTFAINPVHVESVSWIAERKDVLYGLFYFAGLIFYMRYLEQKKIKLLIAVILCFVLSLLSKPMAVVFPGSLLAIDFLLSGKPSRRQWIDKIPFILISLIAGLMTIHNQTQAGAIHNDTGFFERILVASYGCFMYIVKSFFPVGLCSFYPYPETGSMPAIFYFAPLIALLILSVPIYLAWRSGKSNFRLIAFGVAFFLVNFVFVSQLLPSGPNIMADRYTYISSFGVLFPAIILGYYWLMKNNKLKSLLLGIAGVYIIALGILCYNRTLVWHSTETLWTDVIKKYGQRPREIIQAYNNLGSYYFTRDEYDKSYENYKRAIDLGTTDPKVLRNMGCLVATKKDFNGALDYFNKALDLDKDDPLTYLDRAINYEALGKYDLAIADYYHSRSIDPNSEKLVSNMGYFYLNMHQFDSAKKYYTLAINMDPGNAEYYHYRGAAEYDAGEPGALDDLTHALNLDPNNAECMFYLSIYYNKAGDYNNAMKYALMAKNANYNVPDDYLGFLQSKLK